MKTPKNDDPNREDIVRRMVNAAALVKLVCGVGNNAAWMVVLDAYCHAKKCRRFRASIKGGNKVSYMFKRAITEWHDYERNLINATENRMFCVADMSPEVRKRYDKNITDREYYDFWASVGGSAYQKTLPLLTSLWNKHRLSLQHHGVPDAEHVAWVLTASTTLELAAYLYRRAINQCVNEMKIPRHICERVFGQFDIRRVADAWYSAMMALSPGCEYPLEDVEKRNIELGLTQLSDAWISPTILYESTMQSVEDYDEVFATHGQQLKAIREIAEVKNITEKELNNNG